MGDEAPETKERQGIDPLRHIGDILNHFDRIAYHQTVFSAALVELIAANKIDAPDVLKDWERLRDAWVEYRAWKGQLIDGGIKNGEPPAER